MSHVGALPITPVSWAARAVALAVGLAVAFVCLPGVAHAVTDQPDGCPQIKLEGQRLHASFADAAIEPVQFSLGEPPILAWVSHPHGQVVPPSVVSRLASPRAPPTA